MGCDNCKSLVRKEEIGHVYFSNDERHSFKLVEFEIFRNLHKFLFSNLASLLIKHCFMK